MTEGTPSGAAQPRVRDNGVYEAETRPGPTKSEPELRIRVIHGAGLGLGGLVAVDGPPGTGSALNACWIHGGGFRASFGGGVANPNRGWRIDVQLLTRAKQVDYNPSFECRRLPVQALTIEPMVCAAIQSALLVGSQVTSGIKLPAATGE